MEKIILFTMVVIALLIGVNSANAQDEIRIKATDLPVAVLEVIQKKYKKFALNSVVKLKGDKFRIEAQKKNTVYTLTIKNSGEIVKRNKSKVFEFVESKPTEKGDDNGHKGHNHQH